METSLLEYEITDRNVNLLKNVLFVHSTVLSLKTYINQETLEIGYGNNSTTDEVMQCFRNWFSSSPNDSALNRIGFAFHFGGQEESPIFMNQEPFFTDTDLGESVETYSRNVQFMLDLLIEFKSITHVDFLACSTLGNDKWKQYYQLLRLKTGVVIGASDDNTGNMKLGGDWVMETTHEEVGQIYFTAEIENWASLLATGTYTDPNSVLIYSYTVGVLNSGAVSGHSTISAQYFTPNLIILSSFVVNNVTYTVTKTNNTSPYDVRIGTLTIPNTITQIGSSSFCYLYYNFRIPTSVTTIGSYAFANQMFGSKTTVFFDVPSSLTTLDNYVFRYNKFTYLLLPYGITTINEGALVGTTQASNTSPGNLSTIDNRIIPLIFVPSTVISLHTNSFYGNQIPTDASCGNLYMFTSSNSGVTCNYYHYIGGAMPTGTTGCTTFNNIIKNFNTNSTNTLLWQPVTTAVTEVSSIMSGNSYTITFNTIVPSTTYTITSSTSSFIYSSGTLADGSSSISFQAPTTLETIVIKITLSDNTAPINITVTPYLRHNFYHTFYTMDINTPTVLTRKVYDNAGSEQGSYDISFGGINISDILTLMDNGGTNPYTIGEKDNTLTPARLEIAYCDIYASALTSNQNTAVMTYVNTHYKEPHLTATIVYVVTVSENVFWLSANGAIATANPDLLLTYGNMYVFDQSDESNRNHQFTIYTDVGRTNSYINGVVTNGTPGSFNAATWIDVTSAMSGARLYYGVDGGSVQGATMCTSASYLDDFTLTQSFDEGIVAIALTEGKFTVTQYLDAGYTIAQLLNAGLTATQYVNNGNPLSDLVATGLTVTQCINFGFSTTQLKTAGFSVSDFLTAGDTAYTAQNLHSISFTNADILSSSSITRTLVEQIMDGTTYYEPMTAADIRTYLTQAQINEMGFYTTSSGSSATTEVYNLKNAVDIWYENLGSNVSVTDPSHISKWNTVFCTNMSNLFSYKYNFNEDISNWNTSNVTSFHSTFFLCTIFNQSLLSWDVKSVRDFSYMFYDCPALDQIDSIKKWKVSETLPSHYVINMFGNASKMIDVNKANHFIATPFPINTYFNK